MDPKARPIARIGMAMLLALGAACSAARPPAASSPGAQVESDDQLERQEQQDQPSWYETEPGPLRDDDDFSRWMGDPYDPGFTFDWLGGGAYAPNLPYGYPFAFAPFWACPGCFEPPQHHPRPRKPPPPPPVHPPPRPPPPPKMPDPSCGGPQSGGKHAGGAARPCVP